MKGERTAPNCGCVTTGKIVRGMCAPHYDRWVQRTPKHLREPAPRLTRRFEDFIDKSGECWEWTGAKNRGGYGIWSKGGNQGLAHRFSLQAVVPCPDPALFACHRCDNPGCVNPRHLYWGTIRDNTDDMLARRGVYNKGKHMSHCRHGHEMTGDNIRIVGKRRVRICRECDNAKSRERQRRIRKERRDALAS
jgi:hypothetical protein